MNLDRKIPKEAKDKFLVELSHNIFFFSSTWRIFSHFPRISGVQNFTWNCKLTCKRMFFSIVFLGQAPNISTIGIAVCVIFNSLFICVTQRLLGWVVYGFFIRSTWWGSTEKLRKNVENKRFHVIFGTSWGIFERFCFYFVFAHGSKLSRRSRQSIWIWNSPENTLLYLEF